MEQPRELSAIYRANRAREREAIRVVGWVAVVIGTICWLLGGVFLSGFLASLRLAESDGSDLGARDDATFVAAFGFCAAIGCAFATWALLKSKEALRHAVAALILNGLFVLAALVQIVRWL
jgi:hypothetical protein